MNPEPKGERLVVLGGCFNPPTIAHMALIRHAMLHAMADGGVLVPSSQNYVARKMRKTGGYVFSEEDRLRMVKAAIGDSRKITYSTCEYGDDGRGHSYKTMLAVAKEHPGKECCFMMGGDNLHILPRWHDIKAFLTEFRFVVISRDHDDAKKLIMANPLLRQHEDTFILIPPMTRFDDVSSTKARELLFARRPTDHYLHPAVASICKLELAKQKLI